MQIDDGTGSGAKVKVTKENALSVAAIIQGEIEHESEDNGAAYNWSSDLVDVAAANGTVLLVKNTSDTPLHIEYVEIANGAVASEYTVHLPTAEVTPTGAAITGTNLNTGSANIADADAKADETNNTQGNVIATVWLAVDRNIKIRTPGLILAKNKSLGVDVVADTAESAVSIVGHYAD